MSSTANTTSIPLSVLDLVPNPSGGHSSETFANTRDLARRAAPHAMLGVSVVCAETTAEADFLAGSHDLMWLLISSGQRGQLPTAEQAAAFGYSPEQRALVAQSRELLVWGDPAQVRTQLLELAERYQVDEFIITTHIASHEARGRSYELVAEALQGGQDT